MWKASARALASVAATASLLANPAFGDDPVSIQEQLRSIQSQQTIQQKSALEVSMTFSKKSLADILYLIRSMSYLKVITYYQNFDFVVN